MPTRSRIGVVHVEINMHGNGPKLIRVHTIQNMLGSIENANDNQVIWFMRKQYVEAQEYSAKNILNELKLDERCGGN